MKDCTFESSCHFHLITLDIPRLDVVCITTGDKRTATAGKSLALITYLALAPGHSASRDTLCDLLWGDRSLGDSRPLLRQTLWLIKTQINESILHADASTVSLACAIDSDVAIFVSSIEQNDLHNAILLYQADFFTGYGAPGAGRFEEWANSERTRLRRLFLNAAETLAREALNCGRFHDAIGLARRMRAIDPNGQAPWRLQLEARIASGDVVGAHADADQLEEWLRTDEWEAEPETLAAIRAAKRSASVTTDSIRSDDFVTELVGREKEFSLIHEAWLATKLAGPRFVHIVGESGLGKSRLMQDIVARIRASRGKVRLVRANFAERSIPFSFASAMAEAVASLPGAAGIAPSAAKTLIALNPKLSSQYSSVNGSERLEPLRVGLAIQELIASVADENPIAIALDDLHWCDSHSREALTVVSARLSNEKAFLLSSSRTHYSAGPLQTESPVLELKRFSQSDVTTLFSSLARLPETSLGDQIATAFRDASQGVPLRLLEALRFCVDTGLLIRAGDAWVCPDADALFASLHTTATIERRLSSLSADERELVGLMALCGMPAPRSLVITSSSQDQDCASASVASIERRGLAIVENDSWTLAHDAIAETFLVHADLETKNLLHSRLGIAMSASKEEVWRRRSIQHLAEAGQWKYAALVAAPFLRESGYPSTDTRKSIASLFGLSGSEDVSRIFEALPFRLRHPRFTRHVATIGLPIILGALSILALRGRDQPTTPLLVTMTRTPDGNTELKEAALEMKTWTASTPLTFKSKIILPGWSSERLSHATPRPGTNSWAIYSIYPDSGEGEIDILDIKGNRSRLTHSRGDDRPMSFSPDGKQLLILSTRWSSNGWSDIGIIEMRTGQARRISDNKARYDGPKWSPDGTRIAYNRPENFCVTDSDGSHTRCRGLDGWKLGGELGWVDTHRLYISGDHNGVRISRAIYDVDRDVVADANIPAATDILTDPSSDWVLSTMNLSARPIDYHISPSARFDLARPVTSDSTQPTKVVFLTPKLIGTFLEKVLIVTPHQPIVPGAPHQLTAVGLTHDGRSTEPEAIHWRSLTPDVAAIDSLGVMVASRDGIALIEVSAGGWRKAVDTVQIRRSATKLLVEENWDGEVNKRWRVFGSPGPKLISTHDTIAFLNNGDDAFFSGAYMKRTFIGRDGLAMDIDISTRITRTQWQLVLAALQPLMPQSRLQEWDHKTGYMSGLYGDQAGCWFHYPNGEGKESTTRAPWHESMLLAEGDRSFRIDDGSWYRVRLQLFPDGRCGIAINGRAVMIETGSGPVQYPVLPILQGMSVGTRILVGRVIINSGVPGDVDWSSLEPDGYFWSRKTH